VSVCTRSGWATSTDPRPPTTTGYPLTNWNEALAAAREPPVSRSELLRLAFAQLHPMVYSTALRVTGQPADAEDIVQEVFVTLYEQFDELQVATLPGWLKRTTVLISMNHVRKQGRRAARLQDLVVWPSAGESGNSDPTVVTALAVRSLLDRLPDDLRVVLLAKHLLGLTLEEIAQMLGVSIAAAGRRVQKAVVHVKQLADRDPTARNLVAELEGLDR
jgi:RNA polymerase sigma factor (sigma-70 family)